ncbi:MAG: heparinase II/III family protein [Flavobacteriales bacterium]|nr:heparinase II/III family protein [Flavobacteriales bacterium]
MNFTQIKLILKQPLPIIIGKIKTVAIEKVEGFYWDKKYTNNEFRKGISKVSIQSNLIDLNKVDVTSLNKEVAEYLTDMYLSHRFDLLGSGWVKNSYHSESLGLEGFQFKNELTSLQIDETGDWLNQIVADSHFKVSKEVWTQIISSNKNYEPIDWQKDYKSGFRFDAKKSYNQQRGLITSEGIDLKVPWELSRLQHLPQLAIFIRLLPHRKEEVIAEYKNQVLDFIMANPPGMGVNWNCTMDVGIRAANLALAHDWFVQLDDKDVLNELFKSLVVDYLYAHGRHIVNNFEYKEGLTSNHYLGNVSGLSFVSTYLYGNEEVDSWLLLSLQELRNELPKQFFNDGGNFEGSTSYHRLSGEMFLYSTAILNQVTEDRIKSLRNVKTKKGLKHPHLLSSVGDFSFGDNVFNESYYELLAKTVDLSIAYRKLDGNITQIGDNDNGRFFRLSPCGDFLNLKNAFSKYQNLSSNSAYNEDKFWDENSINNDTFLASMSGFVEDESLTVFSEKYTVEGSVINQLIKIRIKRSAGVEKELNNEIPVLEFSKETEFSFNELENSLLEDLKYSFFPDFGMITFRSELLYLNVAFGNNEKSHHSCGHQHNDKLSVEINVNGKDVVFDPGTYIYTPLPSRRNHFRFTKNHNSIDVGVEQNNFIVGRGGLFNLKKETTVEVLVLNSSCVVLSAKYQDIYHVRKIEVFEKSVKISDACNKEFNQNFNKSLFSNGYGKLVNL